MTRLEFARERIEKYGPNYWARARMANLVIGEWCHIDQSVTLGGQGFGYERDEKGVPLHIPHTGGIKIGNRVDILEGTNIARGTIGDTSIGDDTKIDAFVHVAHNVKIGERCLITAGVIIGGSCEIGNDVFIGLNATIKNHVKIGNNVTIGCGANVIDDVPDGVTVAGNPARIIKQKHQDLKRTDLNWVG